MTLAPGTRLGPYEVASAIGAGGMGEVYRGRDATLNRDVAIKVLPAALGGDLERLGRFKREAQVLASLNHPNIAHVYGFEGDERDDVNGAEPWVFAAVRAKVDGGYAGAHEGEDTAEERLGVARQGEHRPVVRGVRLKVENAEAPGA